MKIPSVSGRKVVKALLKIGYAIDHQTGSHIILRLQEKPFTRITVPNHKAICKGTLRAIMRQANISIEKLAEML